MWQHTREQPATILGTAFALSAAQLVLLIPALLVPWVLQQHWLGANPTVVITIHWAVMAAMSTAFLFVSLGATRIFLNIVSGRASAVSLIFTQGESWVPAAIASVIAGVLVLLGALMMVVPGFILGIALQFFPFIIVEKRRGPLDALARSSELTDGYKMQLIPITLFVVVGGLLANLVMGPAWLAVGVPIILLGQAVVYRSLWERHAYNALIKAEA